MDALQMTVLQWRQSVAEESPEIPVDKESLVSCVARIKETKDLVQGLLPRIRDLENKVADISVSSAKFLTPDEFHHMFQSRDNLLKLYDMVQQCVLMVSDCLQTIFELTNTADNMIAETRHWAGNCLARLKVIEEIFRNGECDLETALMEIEVVEADVAFRKAGLASLNKVEEDLNTKYNDCLIELNILRKLAQPPLPAIDYRHSASIQSSRFNNYFISVTQAVHDLKDKLSRAKHAHDKFVELSQQIDIALTNSKDIINKSRPDSTGESRPDMGFVRCQLDQLQAANDELISKKFIIKELQASVEQYENLFGKNCAQPKQFIGDIEKLQKRVESVEKELCSDIHALNDRLSESESLQKQLYSFDDWLYDVESKGHVRRLLPLNSKELCTLIAEQRAVLSDVENHKHVLSSLLRKLSDDGEIVQVQAKQLETRLEAAEKDLRSYLSHLTQALDIVDNFVKCADSVRQELDMVQSEILLLNNVDILDLDLQKTRLEQVSEKLDTLRGDIETVQMCWKDLKMLPNKSDADLQACYFKLQTAQDCWKKSQRLVMHRSEAQSRLSDKLTKFDEAALVFSQNITEMEHRLVSIGQGALLENSVDRHLNELVELKQCQFSELKAKLDSAEAAHMAVDGLLNIGSPGRTALTSKMTLLCQRYDALAENVAIRMNSILKIKAILSSGRLLYEDIMHSLHRLQLPMQHWTTLAKSTSEAQRCMYELTEVSGLLKNQGDRIEEYEEHCKGILEEKNNLYDCQNLKNRILDLSSQFHNATQAVDSWVELMNNVLDFYRSSDALEDWLNAKQGQLQLLVQVAADSAGIESQAVFLADLRQEFASQAPALSSLREVRQKVALWSEAILSKPYPPVEEKLSFLNQLWEQLLTMITERCAQLEKSKKAGRQFSACFRSVQGSLNSLMSAVDLALASSGVVNVNETINQVEKLSERLREHNADLISLKKDAKELSNVCDCPSTIVDVQSKVSSSLQRYEEIGRKIEGLRTNAESAASERSEVEQQLVEQLQWTKKTLQQLEEISEVSANPENLLNMSRRLEEIFDDAMSKEGKVSWVLSKSSGSQSASKESASELSSVWQELVTKIKQRKTQVKYVIEMQKQLELTWDGLKAVQEDSLKQLEECESSTKTADLETAKKLKLKLDSISRKILNAMGDLRSSQAVAEQIRSMATCDFDDLDERMQSMAGLDGLDGKCYALQHLLASRLIELQGQMEAISNGRSCLNRLCDSFARCTEVSDSRDRDRLHDLLREVNEVVQKNAERTELISKADHVPETTVNELKSIQSDLMNLQLRLEEKVAGVDDVHERREKVRRTADELMEQVQSAETQLAGIDPRLRDAQNVDNTLSLAQQLLEMLTHQDSILNSEMEEAERLSSSGYSTDAAQCRQQLLQCKNRLGSAIMMAKDKVSKLAAVKTDLAEVLSEIEQHFSGITEMLASDILQGPLKLNIADLNNDHAKTLLLLFQESVESQTESASRVLDRGCYFVRSAAPGVDVLLLQMKIKRLEDALEELTCKFSELLDGFDQNVDKMNACKLLCDELHSWLLSTEDLVANQRPPSFHFKVAKAQLGEQTLLRKLLDDKHVQLSRLKELVTELIPCLSNNSHDTICAIVTDLCERFDRLTQDETARTKLLNIIADDSCIWHKKSLFLSNWMQEVQKRLRLLDYIATNEEKLASQQAMAQALVQEVEEHRACLDELVEVGERLRELLYESEVQELDDQMNRIVNVFEQLSGSCVVLTESADRMHDCLSMFATNSVEVQNWIAEMERRVRGIGPVSAFADVLDQQTRIMMGLGEEISNYQAKISELVELGCILSQRTTGDEAVVLQSRLDMLRMRYSDLNKEADHILGILGEVLPLVESFQKIHQTLCEWLLSSEGDLIHLGEVSVGEQLILIKNIQEDIEDYRLCFDQMNSTATKLCQLTEDGGSAIENMTSRLNCRFDSVCEQIQRKSERLCRAQLEWKDLVNMLDDLIDWFHQMDGKLTIDSSPISASPNVIRQQLQSHVVAHEDVMVQKAKARELSQGAKRVLKVLSGEERQSLEDRVETLNELVNNVCSISSSFLARLEEACTYAVEFDDACRELDEWLTTMETELENSPPLVSASQPDRLKRQLDFSMTLYKELLDARLSVEKMNKNGISLRPFVSQDDDLRIADVMEQIDRRFHVIRETVQMRIEAFEEALSQTSQYTDRLDGMLESLNVCQESVNASGMISANPDRLRQQISENLAIVAEVERKTGAYQNLVDGAAEMASSGDELAMEIDQKVELLKSVWKDLLQNAESRRRTLQDALNLAEAFWAEFGDCLGDMKQLHECVVGAEKPACQLPLIGAMVEEFQQLEAGFSLLESRIDQCREVGCQLMELVDPVEKLEMMEKMDQLTNFQQVVCEALTQRSELLTTTIDKASLFHEKHEIAEKFITDTEAFLQRYSALSSDPMVLHQQMVEVAKFKEKFDRGAVDLEQLNQLCSDLCELSGPAQSNSIKTTMGSLNKQWDTLNSSVVELYYKLESTLLQMGHFHQAVDQLIDWIEKTEAVVASINTSPGDLKRAEIELVKMKVIQNDLLVHQVSVDTLNSTLMKTIESQAPKTSKELQDKVDTLNLRWNGLHQTFEEKMQLLEKSRSESEVFYDSVGDYVSWMSDVEAALSVDRAVGGLPDTARDQLNRFMLIYKDVQERKPKIEQLISEGEAYVHSMIEEGGQSPTSFAELLESLRERREALLQKVDDRKSRLSAALQEAIEYDEMMSDFIRWLDQAESYLNSLLPISRIKEKLVAQMQSHQAFQEQMDLYRTKGVELDKRGVRMTFNCLRKDATAIKNLLNTTVSRWNKMRSRAADRTRALDSALCETQSFLDQWNDLNNWCSQSVAMIESDSDSVPRNSDRIKEALNQIAEFRQLLAARQSDFDAVCRLGRQLKNHGPRDEEPIVDDMLNTLKQKWNGLSMMTLERQRNLEEALLFSGHFSDAVATLMSYLSTTEAELAADAPVLGDLDTVTALLEKHKSTLKGLSSLRVNVDTIRQAANKMMNTDSEYDANIADELRNLETRWDVVNKLAEKRQLALEDARKMAEQFHKDLKDLQHALADLEGRTKAIGFSADHEEELQSRIDSVEELLANLAIHEPDLSSVIGLGGEIQAHCHPDAEAPVHRALMDLKNRWDQVKLLMTERCERLKNQLKTMQEMEILLDDLMQWMSEQQRTLTVAQEQSLPHDLEAIEKLLEEHEVFENQLQSRQPDVDAVTKGHRKAETEQRNESSSSKSSRRGHYVPSVKGKALHKVDGNAKVKFVADKWRDLWLRSMDYKKRLNETLEYEREVKRLKNFSFDEWRIRYLKWINHKKSRVMDFFRRLDKDCDGKVIRDDFIDGFLASKFPTSRVEMSFVADLFDRNQEGYIDYMEFIDALRPDREPVTEAEKIKDEVQRQAELCTCDNKYLIKQIGDGKYKFGEQMRLVRILRSTVMVRVGGGWVSLTEYLMKYDPCRAKGKTNLELREKFILPDGASQSMWCFRSKGTKGYHSRDSSDCNTPGPIIKIREKTERSLPMYSRSRSRQKGDDSQEGSTLSYGSSRSIGERDQTDSPGSLSGSQTTPCGNNLKVPSAQVECRADCESVSMSRPPSRASTEVSEYSTPSRDSLSSPYPSRIPSMRRKKKKDGK